MLARAASLDFNFGSLASHLQSGAIQTFMNTTMGALGTVVVSPGAITNSDYTADGNLVGNNLAHSDGTYIMNNQGQTSCGGCGTQSNEIKMVFSGLAKGTYTFSFDFEIFPDNTCTDWTCSSGSANWPDLDLEVNGTQVQEWLGKNTAGHGVFNPNPQLLGNSSTAGVDGVITPTFTIDATHTTATLEFLDWPPSIAIDDLDISCGSGACITHGNNSTVPETSSVLLLGTVSGLLVPLFRRFRKA